MDDEVKESGCQEHDRPAAESMYPYGRRDRKRRRRAGGGGRAEFAVQREEGESWAGEQDRGGAKAEEGDRCHYPTLRSGGSQLGTPVSGGRDRDDAFCERRTL